MTREENHRLIKQLQRKNKNKEGEDDRGDDDDVGDDGGMEEGVDDKEVVEEHDDREASEHYTQLRRELDAIAGIHMIQKEIVRWQQQLHSANKEKSQFGKERDILMEQEKANRTALQRQLGEINTRIEKQSVAIANLSSTTEAQTKKNNHHDVSVSNDNDNHDKEHQSAVRMRMLRNYEEHREELEDRLEQPWALSEDASLRLQELTDELGDTSSQHTLSTHPLNTPSQRTLSTHPLNTPMYRFVPCTFLFAHSTHLSIYPFNTSY